MNLGLGLIAADEYFREGDRRKLRERADAEYEESKRDREESRLDRATNRQRQVVADQRAAEEWNLKKSEAERVAAERQGLRDVMTTAESYSPAAQQTAAAGLADVPESVRGDAKAALDKHFSTTHQTGLANAASRLQGMGKIQEAEALRASAKRWRDEGMDRVNDLLFSGASEKDIADAFNSVGEGRIQGIKKTPIVDPKTKKVIDYAVDVTLPDGSTKTIPSFNELRLKYLPVKEQVAIANEERRTKAAEAMDKRHAALTAKQMAEIDRKGSERDASVKALKAMAGLADLNQSASSQKLTDEQLRAVEDERRSLMNVIAEGGYDPTKYAPGASSDFAKNNLKDILAQANKTLADLDAAGGKDSPEYQEANQVRRNVLKRLGQLTETEPGGSAMQDVKVGGVVIGQVPAGDTAAAQAMVKKHIEAKKKPQVSNVDQLRTGNYPGLKYQKFDPASIGLASAA